MEDPNAPKLGQLAPDTARRDAVHVAVLPAVCCEPRLYRGDHVTLNRKGKAFKVELPDAVDEWDQDFDPKKYGAVGIVDPFLSSRKEGGGPVVELGERFWVFLYPGTVASLTHRWSHPAFPEPVAATPTPEVSPPWRTAEVVETCREVRKTGDLGLFSVLASAALAAGYPDGDGSLTATACDLEAKPHRVHYHLAKIEGGLPGEALEWILDFVDDLRAGMTYDTLMAGAEAWLDPTEKWNYMTQQGGERWRDLMTSKVAEQFWSYYEVLTGRTVRPDRRSAFVSCSC